MQSSSENRKCGQKEATAKTMEICCEAGFGHYYIVTVFENYRKSITLQQHAKLTVKQCYQTAHF